MTDHGVAPGSFPPGGPAPTNHRQLQPGGGSRLRQTYLVFLVVAVLVVVLILSFALFAAVSAAGDDDVVTLLIGGGVVAISSGCLIIALLRGRAAVRGDRADIAAASSSRRAARVGSLMGWIGALAVVMTGIIQNYQQVDMALLQGIVLGGATLILAVGNDSAHRMARQITG